jgi:hypothetical protein
MMKKPIHKLLAVALAMSASTAIAAPRTLANGAPAPGNTVAKGDIRWIHAHKAETEVAFARKELAAAIAEEKAAAAAGQCGDQCTTERTRTERVERLVQASAAVRSLQARVARLQKDYDKALKLAKESDAV